MLFCHQLKIWFASQNDKKLLNLLIWLPTTIWICLLYIYPYIMKSFQRVYVYTMYQSYELKSNHWTFLNVCVCKSLGFFQATKVYWKWSNRPVHCANKCMICSHEKLINETGFLMNLFWIWMFSIFCLADGLLKKITLQKVRHLDSAS